MSGHSMEIFDEKSPPVPKDVEVDLDTPHG